MFVNAVAALWPFPGETAESLLARLQALEREFGRLPRRILNEPRRLDLDLIAFRREIWDTPSLVLPHPRACQRRFVLQPLCEIAPQWVFPGRDLTASQALEKAPLDPLLRRLV